VSVIGRTRNGIDDLNRFGERSDVAQKRRELKFEPTLPATNFSGDLA
jgi:hypothetical protein